MPALRWQWVMIGLDTNVVLRWLTAADSNPEQNQAALRAVDAADDMIFLNDIVIAECCWVLATRFRLSRPDQAAGFTIMTSRSPTADSMLTRKSALKDLATEAFRTP